MVISGYSNILKFNSRSVELPCAMNRLFFIVRLTSTDEGERWGQVLAGAGTAFIYFISNIRYGLSCI